MMKRNKKSFLLLLALTLLLTVTVGGTLAYLHTRSSALTNSFRPGHVACRVEEDNTVTNTGNVDAYIRAAVVVNWVDDSGNVYVKPFDEISIAGTNWEKSDKDGYYYYQQVVPADAATEALTVALTGEAPSGCHAQVQILAEAIQAGTLQDHTNAALKVWGVTLG